MQVLGHLVRGISPDDNGLCRNRSPLREDPRASLAVLRPADLTPLAGPIHAELSALDSFMPAIGFHRLVIFDWLFRTLLIPVATGAGWDELDVQPLVAEKAFFLSDVVGQRKDCVVDFDLHLLGWHIDSSIADYHARQRSKVKSCPRTICPLIFALRISA